MTTAELGFLLLCCDIGDGLAPMSLHQVSLLRRRMVNAIPKGDLQADITPQMLRSLGYSEQTAMRLHCLLSREAAVQTYLALGAAHDCHSLTCISNGFPQSLRPRLGRHCPTVLFYKGKLSLLQNPKIAVVGSRQLHESGRQFAEKLGKLAAQEGYTLVSGNAIGADKTAQEACLAHGGSVICVISDALSEQSDADPSVLYLSESGWHQPFSAVRALQRNRLIYALGEKSFVAQCAVQSGTRSGAEEALKQGISTVFVNDDGSAGAALLNSLGASYLKAEACDSIKALTPEQVGFLF